MGLGRIAHVQVGNLSVNSTEAIHLLHPLVPLVSRNVTEEHPQVQLGVAPKLVFHVCVEFPELIHFAVKIRNLPVDHGRIGRSLFKMGSAILRNDQRLLVTQNCRQ